MVEGPSKRDPAVLTGRTRQNKLVHFPPTGGGRPAGAYATVRVTGSGAHHLAGELVRVTAPRPHRVRIPVSAG